MPNFASKKISRAKRLHSSPHNRNSRRVSDGTALVGGLTLVLLPSLLAQAMFRRFFSGAPTVNKNYHVGFPRLFSWLLFTALAANLLILCYALRKWGAREIRAELEPQFGLMLVGQFWIFFFTAAFAWLGISLRDDSFERRNPAAFIPLLAAIIALNLIYAGGNIGEGPSYADNFFSAGLGTLAFFLLWLALDLSAGVSSRITEDRDLAAGVRLAGFFLAQGLILARAVAGDWHSVHETLHDFAHDAIFVIIPLLAAIPIERLNKPTPENPTPNWRVRGLPFALIYIACAVLWLIRIGPWEGFTR
jgi:hypothetical protein